MKKTILIILLLALAPLLFTGCGPKTKITSSWVNKEQSPEIKTVLIIALSKDETTRRLWEKTFAEKLAAENVRTVASHTISEAPIAPEKEAVFQVIQSAKADTVIISHLIDSQTTTNWHPGSVHLEPTAFYGGMYRYYGTAYRTVYTPPTSTDRTVVRLESNMYDVASAGLLWAAQSSTVNPKLLKDDFEAIVKTLIGDMKKNNVLR